MNDPFAAPVGEAVAVGTGRLTLDVIVVEGDPPERARAQGGGTCGNVLTNLACLGWTVYPLTDLGDDEPGRRYCRDLERWGVRLDLIRALAERQTPVIIHHVRPEGHFYSSRCPFCDERLQYYEPVPLEGVESRLAGMATPRVCFFDRDSPGSLRLAAASREQGALVVYEPNYAGPESRLEDAVALAHVVKYSQERLGGLAERHRLDGPWLVIETLGRDGLRVRDQRQGAGEWEYLSALPVPVVRDAGGSGDWCTAGLLHCLGQAGAAGLWAASREEIREGLRFGQALAAWNCAFVGARGGVYQVEPTDWRRDVRRLLAGERFDPAESAGESTQEPAGSFCPRCEGTGKVRKTTCRPS